ncbi:MAG: hypothetical protein Q8M22_16570 [Actinomycetota bacterium]|nr:hypothetical protein [Actinomycetota bacterium]
MSTRGLAAWGFGFRFESDDQLLADVVARCYRDLPRCTDAPHVLRAARAPHGVGFRVSVESPDGSVEECGDGRARDAVLELLHWEINRRALRSVADRTVLHAVVIGGPAGAVALCGPSHSGKSTLAAAAALRGWRHLSDDMGLIDTGLIDAGLADTGLADTRRVTVAPYARPIMVRLGGRGLLGAAVDPPAEHRQFFGDEWFLPASDLGAVVGPDPVPLVGVGFLEWQPAASLAPMSRAEALHDLTLHCATVAARGAAGFSELARVAASVPSFRVGLGTPSDALDLLEPLIRPGAASR